MTYQKFLHTGTVTSSFFIIISPLLGVASPSRQLLPAPFHRFGCLVGCWMVGNGSVDRLPIRKIGRNRRSSGLLVAIKSYVLLFLSVLIGSSPEARLPEDL